MKFSVSIFAEGDREITLEEVVELADAVAIHSGLATGAGTTGFQRIDAARRLRARHDGGDARLRFAGQELEGGRGICRAGWVRNFVLGSFAELCESASATR